VHGAVAPVLARLGTELEAATSDGRLEVVLQPVVDAVDRTVVARHARARWNHPRLGPLTARACLPLLVEPQAARRFDRAILELALAAAAGDDRQLTVPVTTASAVDDDLAGVIAPLLAAHQRAADALRLAVHVSSVAHAELRRATHDLANELGVRLVVTGLGTAPVSWRDLAALPLVGLELDADAVRDHGHDLSRAVLRAGAATGAAWDLEVGAAGVDDDATFAAVVAAGCTRVRGRIVRN
jgi:EAL domain-containing protein (putative c-di-GMP-specific phosphodiesterase class I)